MSRYEALGFAASERRAAIGVGLLHLAFCALCVWAFGVRIGIDPFQGNWDSYWQMLPMDLLRSDLLRSLWYLHAQPPLYNLWGAIFGKLAYPHHMQAMHVANMLLGSAAIAMGARIALYLIPSRRIALATIVLFALSPTYVVYEAYPLYTLPAAVLVVTSVFCLLRYRQTESSLWLCGFMAVLSALALTRSVYQPVLLGIAGALACAVAPPQRLKRVLLVSAISLALPLAVCAKNAALFGFFGTSSWAGMGLWHVVSADLTPERYQELVGRGVIAPEVAALEPFTQPSSYREYGYTKVSDIPALATDDFMNVNIPDISRAYLRSSLNLLREDPVHYAHMVLRGYLRFCVPSAEFKHALENDARIPLLSYVYDELLEGHAFARAGRRDYGGWLCLLLPLAALLHTISLTRRARAAASIRDWLRQDLVLLWTLLICFYTVAVTSMAELGENNRFKVLVELLLWIAVVAAPVRAAKALPERVGQEEPGQPPDPARRLRQGLSDALGRAGRGSLPLEGPSGGPDLTPAGRS